MIAFIFFDVITYVRFRVLNVYDDLLSVSLWCVITDGREAGGEPGLSAVSNLNPS